MKDTEPPYLYYRWEHQEKQRYYAVYLNRDLFGWCLTKVWGGIRANTGDIKHLPCESYQNGAEQIEAISKRRRQRHYHLVWKKVLYRVATGHQSNTVSGISGRTDSR